MSEIRARRSFSRQRCSNNRICGGVSAGSAAPIRLAAHDRGDRVGDVFAFERARRRQHFEQHAAKRPHVAALVDDAALCLFGAHVGGGAEDQSGLRHRRRRDRRRVGVCPIPDPAPDRIERLRQTEIEHLDRAVVADLDVGGFQIAMDDPAFVRRFERIGDLPRDGDRFVNGDRSLGDAIGERRALTNSITRNGPLSLLSIP